MKFKVPVVWQMATTLEIEADSLQDAEKIAIEDSELPGDGEYISDSFEIDRDSIYYGEVVD